MKRWLRKWLGVAAEHTLLYQQQLNVVARLNSLLNRVERLERKTSGLELAEAAQQNGGVEYIFGALGAVEKKIGKIVWKWVDDPNELPPQRKQRREWYIEDKKKHGN